MSDSTHPTDDVPAKPTISIRAEWLGGHRFETGRVGSPMAVFDGEARMGQNPVDALVSALATCTGIDVVDILNKRRTPAARFVVEAHAERRPQHPRRLEKVTLTFRVDGPGIEAAHVERAAALALEKYCSVAASLASDVVIETVVDVNSGDVVR
jgi:putative redox protein